VSPGPQVGAVNGVLVESPPLLKRLLGSCLVFFRVPVQHPRVVLEAGCLAESFNHGRRVVKQVISINDADLNAMAVAVGAVGLAIGFGLASELRADLSLVSQVVEQAAKLVVASLIRPEVVETRHLVQRRYRAAVVAGNAVFRMTDQEGEVVGCEEIGGDHGRVVWLALGVVRVWRTAVVLSALHRREPGGICSNATLVVGHGRCDACRLAIGWYPVLSHIFDKSALAL
jgi:hypothetical protein